jgi:hypothetical protein
MNTIVFVAAGAILLLVVLAKIPGLEHLVKPLIDLLFSLLKVIAENMTNWFVVLFKLLWQSHMELMAHLVFKAESLDATVAMREKENG